MWARLVHSHGTGTVNSQAPSSEDILATKNEDAVVPLQLYR